MKPEEIHLTDIMRMLQGNVPWAFLIEVVIRIFFIYFLLILSMRLMGKRMASTLARNELAALVSLAAAVGMALQDPEKGLLPAIIICLVVVGIQRIVAILAFRSKNFERVSQGNISILVEDGCLNLEDMKKCLLTRERAFAQIRSQGIDNLGRVQRMYMETSGSFSILEYQGKVNGLSLIPEWDHEFWESEKVKQDIYACNSCGNLQNGQDQPGIECPRCKEKEWVNAVECN
jgi:uncharacterized membrane protein YcaP (DUF421 family)